MTMLRNAWAALQAEPVVAVTLALSGLAVFGLVEFTDAQREFVLAAVGFLFAGGAVARRAVTPNRTVADLEAELAQVREIARGDVGL